MLTVFKYLLSVMWVRLVWVLVLVSKNERILVNATFDEDTSLEQTNNNQESTHLLDGM